ncbi:hypothetical protein [Streptomyces sp. CA-111067]|uniref:hypothetical protein n=1 Tax=Streptomyces sp. CA-111067 TaxID=3240046 RepID=UPI003D972260
MRGPNVRRGAAALLAAGCLAAGAVSCSDGPAASPSAASPSAAPASVSASAAGSPSRGAGGGGPAPVPTTGLASGLVLPLEAYMENYDQEVAINKARGNLESACMARYAFTFAPKSGGSAPSGYDGANMPRRYGVADPAEAARYGYHLADDTAPPSQPPMSDAEYVVLMGSLHPRPDTNPTPPPYHGKAVPAGGCVGEATRTLQGTAPGSADLSLPERLDVESLQKAQDRPGVRHALAAWSGCMAARGYKAATPFDAMRLPPSAAGPKPDKQEIATAVADVSCKQRTGLVRTWFDAEVTVQHQQIAADKPALDAAKAQIDAMVKAAAAATGDASAS